MLWVAMCMELPCHNQVASCTPDTMLMLQASCKLLLVHHAQVYVTCMPKPSALY